MAYSVIPITGLQPSTHRGLAFLGSTTDATVSAKQVFESLANKQKRDVLARLDYWLSGGRFDKYFHGWPNDKDRKECFVFKWKQAGTYHRLYGFLFHPRPNTDPGFQVCILVSHARKNTEHTDPSELNAVNALRLMPEVIMAVKRTFA
jgi:hypothetical protein